MARQFVYFMQGLSKTYPPNRKVLDNIHLSFYPDAKIGVLGVNGSGKSTLLRIMAGLDKEYTGEAWVAEGARVGYLERERHDGSGQAEGHPGSVQRAGSQLFRRDRR
jgi:ATPase subunit of ABC transporter with duplicated ATPase domains